MKTNDRIPTRTLTSLLLICLLQGTLFIGCSQSEQPGGEDNGESPELVPVQVAGATLSGEVATRATTTNLTTGTIGVYNTTAVTGIAAVYDRRYTYNGTSKKWEAGTPIYAAGTYLSLCAYHPAGAIAITPNTFQIDIIAQEYAADKDLSFAPTSAATLVSNMKPEATFAMTRAYSQLSLEITRTANFTGLCKVTKIVLKGPGGSNFQSVRTQNISTGAVTDKTATTTLTYPTTGTLTTGIAAGTTNTTFHLLMPPQPLAKGLNLTLTIDGLDYSLGIAPAQLSTLVAGKRYVVDIKIDGTDIALKNVSTTEWVQGTNPPPGNGSVIQS